MHNDSGVPLKRAYTAADRGAKLCLDVFANDEDETVEATAHRIEDRILDDQFALRADRLHLFEAAEPAAHARCKNDEVVELFSHGPRHS